MVGWYPELMITRIAMLRSRGYRIAEAYGPQEALQIFDTMDVALAVICQSIPRNLRRTLIANMKLARPSTPVLAFGIASQEADICLPILSGPEALLSSVASLVSPAKNLRKTTIQR
jgi:hypothetical protein